MDMTNQERRELPFQVTALAPAGNRVVISRHMTRAAAERAARKGTSDFRVEGSAQ